MKEWNTYKLKDICLKITDGSHFSPTACADGYPMFSVKDMEEYGFNYSSCKRISAEDFNTLKANDCIPQKGDVLVAKDGSFLKQIFVCNETREEAILSSIAIFRPNPEYVIPEFLCYILKSPKVYNYIAQNCVSGSALPRIVLKAFKDVEVSIPSIDIQKWIISKLTPIDQKIQLNRQINDNLEQQAQALYKSWFVDNQHPDCEEINLSEIIYFQEGPGIRNWQYVEKDGVRFINIRCIDGGDINLTSANMISKEEANGKYAHFLLKPFDIIMSCSGTLGRYAIVRKEHLPLCLNTSVIRFSPNRSDSDYSYIYGYLASEEFLNKQVEMACGSVQANFGPTHLKQIKIIAPPIDYCKKYNTIAMPIINKILENRREIQELHTLRNTLLPKLMSGELNINEIDR